jgi:hypothetical protein
MENFMVVLQKKKLRMQSLCDPVITLWIYIQKNWMQCLQEIFVYKVNGSIIHNNQEVEATQMS